jgi:DNA-binding transcriptional regulator PaaX
MTNTKTKGAVNKTRSARTSKPKSDNTRKSKTALVREMLQRADGAGLDELCKMTGWQSHTVRAALSGLRKAGDVIDRTKNEDGKSIYRITAAAEAK